MKKEVLQKETICGFPAAELIGIVLMVIPCIICIVFNVPGFKFLGKVIKSDTNIRPDMPSTLCAVAFYLSLIVRYDFFKKKNIGEIVLSSVQTILNVWALSALISIVLSAKNEKATYLMIFAIALSWLGMKTIAGYSWILFIVSAIGRLMEIGEAMGMLGAVFVLALAVSLLLQVSKISNLKMFMEDFRSTVHPLTETVKEEIGAATDDAGRKVEAVKNMAKASFGASRMMDYSSVAAAGENYVKDENKDQL